MAARKRKSGSGQAMGKGDITMGKDTIISMVDTLSKSVSGIALADTADREALLKTTFQEFQDALVGQVDADLGKAVEEQIEALAKGGELVAAKPMYKGLGTVGRVAQLVSYVDERINAIKEGKDWSGQEKASDPASATVNALLEGMLNAGMLAMSAAVNEKVAPAEKAEFDEMGKATDHLPAGMILMKVAVPGLPEDDGVMVKTTLPVELAERALDPGILADAAVSLGADLMVLAGIEKADLDAFLAKADGEEIPPGEVEPGGGEEGEDMDPVEMIGRLAAAILFTVDQISGGGEEEVPPGEGEQPPAGGEEEPPAGGGEEEPPPARADAQPSGEEKPPAAGGGEGGAGGEGGGEEDEEAKRRAEKAARTEDLVKRLHTAGDSLKKMGSAVPDFSGVTVALVADADALEKVVTNMEGTLEKLAKQPEEPKAVVGPGAKLNSLTKAADTGGGSGTSEEDLEKEARRIANLPPFERATEMTKLVHAAGGVPMMKRVNELTKTA
jgi:hypothetical protein